MTKTSRIVFFGNERLWSGVRDVEPLCLKALIDNGYQVVAVISRHSPGLSRNDRPLEVAAVAAKHNIPLFTPKTKAELSETVDQLSADIGVLAAFGMIVPQTVIDHFPAGIVNIHPSLLPNFRGSTPIEAAILEGAKTTGVSLMQLVKEMDAGPLYAQIKLSLPANESKDQIGHQLHRLGTDLLIQNLPAILNHSLTATPQSGPASYCPTISKQASQLDWRLPAEQLERQIRAYANWPQSRCQLNGLDTIVTAAHVIDHKLNAGQIEANDQQLIIGTGHQSLAIDRLKPAGKAEMAAAAFINGYLFRR